MQQAKEPVEFAKNCYGLLWCASTLLFNALRSGVWKIAAHVNKILRETGALSRRRRVWGDMGMVEGGEFPLGRVERFVAALCWASD
jgi:hypothetical protein